jgi:hypothetical protein
MRQYPLLAMTLSVSMLAMEPGMSRGAFFTPVGAAAEGCSVLFLKADYKATAARYPCGEWFVPEPGDFIVWLEASDQISPAWTVVTVPAPPARNELQMRMPMVDAATIVVDPRDFPENGTVRMVSLSQDDAAFERRVVSREEAAHGVLMPAGMQIVATFGADNRAVALAPLVNVKAGERYRFAPAKLDERGAIFAILDQPHRGWTRDATVTLRRGAVELRPDAVKIVERRIYALWSSVVPGDYTIDVSGMTLENGRALVEKGGVATIRMKLRSGTATRQE